MNTSPSPAKDPRDALEVVVIGAGFGGVNAVRELEHRVSEKVHITWIDRHNYHQFTPLLYQVATAGLTPAEIAVPARTLVDRRVTTLMGTVTAIDLDENVVMMDSKQLHYDYLVIATGAQPHLFGHDEWLPNLKTLESVGTAVQLREHVLHCFESAEQEPDAKNREELLSFVIIGAGPTGVELAGALTELSRRVLARDYPRIAPDDVRVTLLEASDRVLTPFAEPLCSRAESDLRELGVTVHLNTRVHDVRDGQVACDLGAFRAATICWGAGVAPGALIAELDAEKAKGRVRVRADCSLPQDANVFVIGDAAHFANDDDSPLPGLAPVAIQQGKHVARCVEADLQGKARPSFEYRDKGTMATIGRSKAVAQIGPAHLTGFIAWLAWLALHVWFLIGFRARALVMFEWAWAYLRRKRGSRLILGESAQQDQHQRTETGERRRDVA